MQGETDDTKGRIESDSMGEIRVSPGVYWGASTQRAIANFDVSGKRAPTALVEALGLIKLCCAEANVEMGLLDPESGGAVIRAAGEVRAGKWNGQFPVDVFQTGSGTSWNMNANEVIANRANEILGRPLGSRSPVHPNDHVNRGQSSNDVIPAAIHIADRRAAEDLRVALLELAEALSSKTEEFHDVVKLGRTHLQDAVPMTLGQEFSGYAEQIRKGLRRLENTYPHLEELALGGTAVGTGLNAPPGFAVNVIGRIAGQTGIPFRQAGNLFEALACRDAQAELMGALDVIAGSLIKITGDLRLLASGPRAGLGEITLPSLQPGSSIMPGKVNPVIPEMVAQVAVHVKGKAHSVSLAASMAPLELNIMMPLIAHETLESIRLLTNASRLFAQRCVLGIEARRERCADWIEQSLALVTPLTTRIGYDRAAAIAKRAWSEGKTVREVLQEERIFPPDEIDRLLSPRSMIDPATGG